MPEQFFDENKMKNSICAYIDVLWQNNQADPTFFKKLTRPAIREALSSSLRLDINSNLQNFNKAFNSLIDEGQIVLEIRKISYLRRKDSENLVFGMPESNWGLYISLISGIALAISGVFPQVFIAGVFVGILLLAYTDTVFTSVASSVAKSTKERLKKYANSTKKQLIDKKWDVLGSLIGIGLSLAWYGFIEKSSVKIEGIAVFVTGGIIFFNKWIGPIFSNK